MDASSSQYEAIILWVWAVDVVTRSQKCKISCQSLLCSVLEVWHRVLVAVGVCPDGGASLTKLSPSVYILCQSCFSGRIRMRSPNSHPCFLWNFFVVQAGGDVHEENCSDEDTPINVEFGDMRNGVVLVFS